LDPPAGPWDRGGGGEGGGAAAIAPPRGGDGGKAGGERRRFFSSRDPRGRTRIGTRSPAASPGGGAGEDEVRCHVTSAVDMCREQLVQSLEHILYDRSSLPPGALAQLARALEAQHDQADHVKHLSGEGAEPEMDLEIDPRFVSPLGGRWLGKTGFPAILAKQANICLKQMIDAKGGGGGGSLPGIEQRSGGLGGFEKFHLRLLADPLVGGGRGGHHTVRGPPVLGLLRGLSEQLKRQRERELQRRRDELKPKPTKLLRTRSIQRTGSAATSKFKRAISMVVSAAALSRTGSGGGHLQGEVEPGEGGGGGRTGGGIGAINNQVSYSHIVNRSPASYSGGRTIAVVGGGGQGGGGQGAFTRLLSGSKVVPEAGEGEEEGSVDGVFGMSASFSLSLKEEQERRELLATLSRRIENFDKVAAKCKSSSAATCADRHAILAQFEMLGTLHRCKSGGGCTVRLARHGAVVGQPGSGVLVAVKIYSKLHRDVLHDAAPQSDILQAEEHSGEVGGGGGGGGGGGEGGGFGGGSGGGESGGGEDIPCIAREKLKGLGGGGELVGMGETRGGVAQSPNPQNVGRSRINSLQGVGDGSRIKSPPSCLNVTLNVTPFSRAEKGGVDNTAIVISGTARAIQTLKKKLTTFERRISLLRELHTLKTAKGHPCIVHLYGTLQSDRSLYLFFEPLVGGTLADRIADKRNRLSTVEIQRFMAQIVLGVEHLHERSILHRDICPVNLLIDHAGALKIGSFGCARLAPNRTRSLVSCLAEYRAPEMIKGLAYGASVDWWAIGCVLYEMLAGRPAFKEDDIRRQNERILASKYHPIQADKMTKDTIGQFLKKDPRERLGCNRSVKELAFFRGVDWRMLSQPGSGAGEGWRGGLVAEGGGGGGEPGGGGGSGTGGGAGGRKKRSKTPQGGGAGGVGRRRGSASLSPGTISILSNVFYSVFLQQTY
jgi:hypothetical protein